MDIRKEFKYEMAHIVRKARTERCSKNIHGHSYVAELVFEGDIADKAEMLLDFGIIKKVFGDFVDSFDHSFLLWNIPEDKEVIKFAVENFERVIVTPFSSSAEMQAKMFAQVAQVFLHYIQVHPDYSRFCPLGIRVHSAIVHETKTGYAKYKMGYDFGSEVLQPMVIFNKLDAEQISNEPNAIYISEQIMNERSYELHEVYNKYRVKAITENVFTK